MGGGKVLELQPAVSPGCAGQAGGNVVGDPDFLAGAETDPVDGVLQQPVLSCVMLPPAGRQPEQALLRTEPELSGADSPQR